MKKLSLIPVFLVALLASPLYANAQEREPFSPRVTPPGDLIVTERFSSTPLEFDWRLISSDRISRQGRYDFELIYDVDYSTLRNELSSYYSEARTIARLRRGALQFTSVEELRIFGMEVGEERARLTLGHPDLEPVFQVELIPDGRRTRVVINNSTVSRQFSGFVPSRAGFRPANAAPIPFRWN